ncbi:MAG: ribonuclease III family protein [Methanomassiliicoccales archaeon]
MSEERAALLNELEDRISYHFHDVSLLQEALTHRSIKMERGISVRTNTRLEVLGDAILGFIVMEHLYQKFPGADKGELSGKRAEMVCNDRLNEIGSRLELVKFIEIGGSILNQNEGKAKYIVADALESLIAAIHLDDGHKAAWSFVIREIVSEEGS